MINAEWGKGLYQVYVRVGRLAEFFLQIRGTLRSSPPYEGGELLMSRLHSEVLSSSSKAHEKLPSLFRRGGSRFG